MSSRNSGNLISQKKKWSLMRAYFDEKGLVRQHLDSYNEFIKRGLQRVVDEVGYIEPEIEGFKVKLGKIRVGRPFIQEADGQGKEILPMEARIRNLTYSAPIYLKMTPIRNGMEQQEVEVRIGEIPVMLKSEICPLSKMSEEELIRAGEDPRDPGGYFIINGSERVIVSIEDLAVNRIMVEKDEKEGTCRAKVISMSGGFRAPVTVERRKTGLIRVSFPSIPGYIPIVILMKALGLEKDREIFQAISENPEMASDIMFNIERALDIHTQEEALDYIGKRVAAEQPKEYRLKRAEQVLDRYLLPHIGQEEEDRIKKAYFLGKMAERAIELHLGLRSVDDKDHYANKRLKLAGDLMEDLFRSAFQALVKDIRYQLTKAYSRGREPSVRTSVRADLLSDRIKHALATGNWVGGRTGVSQLLDRTNYMSALSHLRRVVSPLSRSQPHFEARDLHSTHWGRICPNETPEGPNCGLVKNLAMMAEISKGYPEEEVEQMLTDLGVGSVKEGDWTVYVNGKLLGRVEDGLDLVQKIKELRRSGEISDQINVAYYEETKEIYVNCDAGRVRRPLIIVENGKPKLTEEVIEKIETGEWKFSDLVRNGIVEYLDAEEEENAYVAIGDEEVTEEHTHVEIDPAAILGICAGLIPYPEHNQSPRNSYEAGMAKQALGLGSANFMLRLDTRGHFLHYPQRPIVKTDPMEVIGFDDRPAGQNVVIAIMPYYGYNMEDAIVISKSAIERGLFRSHFFRTYEADEKKYPGGQEDRFEIPSRDVRGYRDEREYSKLAEDGIIEPETVVSGGEVLIGRTSPPRFLEERIAEFGAMEGRRETSVNVRPGESGIVDTVVLTTTSEGTRLVKVKVRDERIPELGDKFASRHGQKGVIGLIVPQEDLPFTEDGIVPDIIVNPHGIPSRMTVGQLIETIAGKVGALQGRRIDGTAFRGERESDLRELLKAYGFKPNGREVLYDGRTGEMIEAEIFIGITYYQKLHHMVSDKIHARARGPVQVLTRQPTEGRSREGGLRFGEMEKDCLVGHGTAILLKERLIDESDRYLAYVCSKCGSFSYKKQREDVVVCPICKEETEAYQVPVSYAFKLLIDELISMLILPKMRLRDRA